MSIFATGVFSDLFTRNWDSIDGKSTPKRKAKFLNQVNSFIVAPVELSDCLTGGGQIWREYALRPMLEQAGAKDVHRYISRTTSAQLHKVLLSKSSLRMLVADYLASIGEVQYQKQFVSHRLWMQWLKELALVIADNIFRELDARDIGMVEWASFRPKFYTFIGRRYIDPLDPYAASLEPQNGVPSRIDLVHTKNTAHPQSEERLRYRRALTYE